MPKLRVVIHLDKNTPAHVKQQKITQAKLVIDLNVEDKSLRCDESSSDDEKDP